MNRAIGRIVTLIIVAATSPSAWAADSYRILLPIAVSETPGANGTLWASIFRIHNRGPQNIGIAPQTGADHTGLGPGITVEPSIRKTRAGEIPGEWITITGDEAHTVTFQLLLRELNHLPDSAGVEMPVVGEDEFRANGILLIGVPNHSEFRVMLRVYGLDTHLGETVRIRAFSAGVLPPKTLLDMTLNLSKDAAIPSEPGYAQLSLDTALGSFADRLVDIQIETFDPAVHIWAFASVTSNTSQAVTLVTPN